MNKLIDLSLDLIKIIIGINFELNDLLLKWIHTKMGV